METEDKPLSFVFLSNKIKCDLDQFSESKKPITAKIAGVFAELDVPSLNGNLYDIHSASNIEKSFFSCPLYFGVDFMNRHKKSKPIGYCVGARLMGKKLYGLAIVTAKHIVDRLRKRENFRFSWGGHSNFSEIIRRGNKLIRKLHEITVNHLQLVPYNVSVGFPSAVLDRVSFSETLMIDDSETIARMGLLGILQSEELNKAIAEEVIKYV